MAVEEMLRKELKVVIGRDSGWGFLDKKRDKYDNSET